MDAKLYTYTYPQGCLSLGYSAKKKQWKKCSESSWIRRDSKVRQFYANTFVWHFQLFWTVLTPHNQRQFVCYSGLRYLDPSVVILNCRAHGLQMWYVCVLVCWWPQWQWLWVRAASYVGVVSRPCQYFINTNS